MFDKILEIAKLKIVDAGNSQELHQARIELLGKQSALNQEMRKLGSMAEKERKKVGQQINSIREQIQLLFDAKDVELERRELELRFAKEKVDLTLPSRSFSRGTIHPITQCTEELIQIFSKFGFVIKDGPNIETDWYNFTALNIDENHPARQMHDTFYLKDKMVLRTHTSPTQIRTMQNDILPLRIIAPGRTYRSDSDMTHTPMFHQIEGLVIDRDISMANLKYLLVEFIKAFFENTNVEVRFRPSFFPFTEPSAEVDIRMNKTDKWLEVLGCGMTHPNVLKNGGIDSEEYRGFAFGLGIERFAMLKYGIKDLRQFFEGDIRWLKHYNFSSIDIPTLVGGLTR